MTSIQYEQGYLEAALALLEEYLLSPEVYWSLRAAPPEGGSSYPSLTLGNVILALRRLRGMLGNEEFATHALSDRIHTLRTKWQVAWEQKAVHEFQARLTLWRDFLEDFRRFPEENKDRYKYEVQRRVLLELLEEEAGTLPDTFLELLQGLDQVLRYHLVRGSFIWEVKLESAFPDERFWYLYGDLAT